MLLTQGFATLLLATLSVSVSARAHAPRMNRHHRSLKGRQLGGCGSASTTVTSTTLTAASTPSVAIPSLNVPANNLGVVSSTDDTAGSTNSSATTGVNGTAGTGADSSTTTGSGASSGAAASASSGSSGSASMTPHEQYGSSIGVPGCKINVNRVAYWPSSPSCTDICVKVTNPTAGRSLYLLKIDQSGGAYDISYDAWSYLKTGQGASPSNNPTGGGENWDYEFVDASNCGDLLDDGKLPLMAYNSVNYLVSCLAQPSSFVAQNYVLYNIWNQFCTLGVDEVCTFDLATSNQPVCPSGPQPTQTLNEDISNIAYAGGQSYKVQG